MARTQRNRAPAVLAIGELNVDVVASGLRSAPELGRELIAPGLAVTLGSATAIFACQIRKLGHPVRFIARVGKDAFGDTCLRALKDAGIDTKGVLRGSVGTGVTLSMSARNDRAQVTYLGAIAELCERDVPRNVFSGQKHLHLSSFELQRGLRPAFARLFRGARQHGLSTSFDPNSTLTGATRAAVLDLVQHVDLLFLNELEARELSGQRDLRRALALLARNTRGVIIKRGARGALASLDGVQGESRAFDARAIDTTGAGDSFAAGFVSAFLRGEALDECLREGNACGAASTEQLGGTTGQLDRAGLKRRLSAAARVAVQS